MRENHSKAMLITTAVVLAFSWLVVTPLALSAGENAPFHVNSDGTVIAGSHTFRNMTEYVRSDFFRSTGKRCGTNAKRKLHTRGFAPSGNQADCSATSTTIKGEYYPTVTYTIPIVFHVIRKLDGTGNISDQRIYDQVTVLNEDFGAIVGTMGGSGFNTKVQFALAGITRTANDTWHDDQNELEFKTALGWDQDRYLNVYVNSASGYLGYSYLPQDAVEKVYHGVVMLYEAVGGRDNGYDVYDQGRTLVHEIGHHLGLLHTFEGYGCYEGFAAGDLIADTPSENEEHYGCTQTNTCSTPDPIHNYMNYTDDSCMLEFTDEQANRLICSLVNYRPASYCAGTASITVTSPSGQTWPAESTQIIAWTQQCLDGFVSVDLYRDTTAVSAIGTAVASTGSMQWTIPAATTPASDYRVRVSQGPLVSFSAPFTITTAMPTGATAFSYLAPCRVFDTRNSSGPDAASPELAANDRRIFIATGRCGIPSHAKAISTNLTVVNATSTGELKVTGAHLGSTDTIALPIPQNRARANNAIIQLATDGSGGIAVTNSSLGTTHFILDVNGYFY